MEKPFVSLLNDFIEANGKKILDQPDRFRSLFLDFSQNKNRAEVKVFSQFLASQQAMEVKNGDDVDLIFLNMAAERFHEVCLVDKNICRAIVFCYAWLEDLISKETFQVNVQDDRFLFDRQIGQNMKFTDARETYTQLVNTVVQIAHKPKDTIIRTPDPVKPLKKEPVSRNTEVILERDDVIFASAILMKISIDGKCVTEIENQGVEKIYIDNGEHSISAAIDYFCQSKKVFFTAGGKKVSFLFSPRKTNNVSFIEIKQSNDK